MAKMNPPERLTGPDAADPIQSFDFPGAELNQKPAFPFPFGGGKPMLYCITFRSKSDARITGWYTGNNCRWSTDHTRKKLFDQKEEAEPVAMALRERCPANAENIKVETQAVADPIPGEE
jgi:hypothetical protein